MERHVNTEELEMGVAIVQARAVLQGGSGVSAVGDGRNARSAIQELD
jgi:hypothetical protein